MNPPGPVFLTGGSGLVGSHVAALLREAGVGVVALQRPASDTAFLRSLGCRIVAGDVTDAVAELASAAAGCRAAVHAAAVVYGEGPWEAVRAVNVTGTGNVLRASARAGAERAVHLSSVAVYGDAPGPLDESAPTGSASGPEGHYARSKREAEREARAAAAETGMPVTLLRPPAMYGERDRLFTPKLIRLASLPLIPLLGDGRNTLAVAWAGNVAGAVVLALEGRGEGGVFNVTDDGPTTQRLLMREIARGLARSPRFLPVPAGLIRLGARIGDRLGARVPGARDLSLSRVARLALEDNPYPSDRARETLGWVPRVEPDEALRRTVHWFRSEAAAR